MTAPRPCSPSTPHPTRAAAWRAAVAAWRITGRLAEVWSCRHCGAWHFAERAPLDAGTRYAAFAGRRRRATP